MLGFGESGTMDCSSLGSDRIFDLAVRSDTTKGCEVTKYDNDYDPMGGGTTFYAFEAYHRLMAGWLPQSALVTINATTTLTLTDSMLTTGNRAARVVLDDAGSSLYLEYRTPTGINDPTVYGFEPALEKSVHISFVPTPTRSSTTAS